MIEIESTDLILLPLTPMFGKIARISILKKRCMVTSGTILSNAISK